VDLPAAAQAAYCQCVPSNQMSTKSFPSTYLVNLPYITSESLTKFITVALQEDVGDGDHSTLSAIPHEAEQKARMVAKQQGTVAGVAMAEAIFQHLDPTLQIRLLKKDGEAIAIGDTILEVSGHARAILTAERLALNCMQRMSGIATLTKMAVRQLQNSHTKLLDTRKTTPNFRMAEKWAVAIGGGVNHRFGLFDMIMLKDNHIDFAGGIRNAILAADRYKQEHGLHKLKVEVETRSLEEVAQVLEVGKVDFIMLDNMDNAQMSRAVGLIAGRYQTEASGGITLERLPSIAQCGVDFISMGALTHSAQNIDISLLAEK